MNETKISEPSQNLLKTLDRFEDKVRKNRIREREKNIPQIKDLIDI